MNGGYMRKIVIIGLSFFCLQLPVLAMQRIDWQSLERYAQQSHKLAWTVGQVIDYSWVAALALFPLVDRYCMKKVPAWVARDASSEFQAFARQELTAASIKNSNDVYIKISPFANVHMATSFSHGMVVSQNVHDTWHELRNIPCSVQENIFKALIELDMDMIRFILRREASHRNHYDYFKRTALLMGLFIFGKWSEHARDRAALSADASWQQIAARWALNRLKNLAYAATSVYAYSRYSVAQGVRADHQAASTKELAQAGSQFFEQIADAQKLVMGDRIYNFFKKYPAAYEMMLFNKRPEERAEYLEKQSGYLE
ncbi:MAG: hypothetical protein WD068_01920 [Candidatus Babeliales bacterium]